MAIEAFRIADLTQLKWIDDIVLHLCSCQTIEIVLAWAEIWACQEMQMAIEAFRIVKKMIFVLLTLELYWGYPKGSRWHQGFVRLVLWLRLCHFVFWCVQSLLLELYWGDPRVWRLNWYSVRLVMMLWLCWLALCFAYMIVADIHLFCCDQHSDEGDGFCNDHCWPLGVVWWRWLLKRVCSYW